jgi:replication factor C small subunit
MEQNIPWILKYSPKTIDDMVLNTELLNTFKDWINKKTINNVTFYGCQGCGKTTIARILANELNCSNVLFQSCSIDGSIDMVKSKIKDFCDLVVEPGTLKIIILDEADSLTSTAGNNAGAQMALRNIIAESLEDTRFILTCNYIDRIIPALQSRCTPIKLDFSIQDIAKLVLKILTCENIKYTKESFSVFLNNIVKVRFPDVRSIIEYLQLSCQSGELKNSLSSTDVQNDEVIQFIATCNDVMQIREYIQQNEDKFSADYIQLAGKLFNYYTTNPEVMLTIAEYIYKMSIVLDKEIQFFAMIVTIKKMIANQVI